ncbi:hypothetical protein [Mesorhizobium sp.]|uniref:hypothetical protein n=1 Tax=Mesorhizobium sp. TaxID=1871066 RepID=UPI000FE52E04|nr:hypothetical protein [Mesorhizobium sp.]RWI08320.1 MAG: hypothetical protein EOQ90_19220 [Mesorhizobium sp.]RWM87669.1 MAG: hypothetical protein EOR83_03095 [Mesorhizobium sp.]
MEEPFFVCVYKKDGMPIGQIVSPENEFPESFEEIKVKSSDGDNIEEKASEFEKIFESYCNSILSYIDMLPFIASISPMVGDAIRSVGLINFLKENQGRQLKPKAGTFLKSHQGSIVISRKSQTVRTRHPPWGGRSLR